MGEFAEPSRLLLKKVSFLGQNGQCKVDFMSFANTNPHDINHMPWSDPVANIKARKPVPCDGLIDLTGIAFNLP